jgi:hypothetical protein
MTLQQEELERLVLENQVPLNVLFFRELSQPKYIYLGEDSNIDKSSIFYGNKNMTISDFHKPLLFLKL